MRLQIYNKEEPKVDLTSLIDVVFLLLIFFMVSTTFERESVLKVDLPEASAVDEREELLVVLVGFDHVVYPQPVDVDARPLLERTRSHLVDHRARVYRHRTGCESLCRIAGQAVELVGGDLGHISDLAARNALVWQETNDLPANNKLIVFRHA